MKMKSEVMSANRSSRKNEHGTLFFYLHFSLLFFSNPRVHATGRVNATNYPNDDMIKISRVGGHRRERWEQGEQRKVQDSGAATRIYA